MSIRVSGAYPFSDVINGLARAAMVRHTLTTAPRSTRAIHLSATLTGAVLSLIPTSQLSEGAFRRSRPLAVLLAILYALLCILRVCVLGFHLLEDEAARQRRRRDQRRRYARFQRRWRQGGPRAALRRWRDLQSTQRTELSELWRVISLLVALFAGFSDVIRTPRIQVGLEAMRNWNPMVEILYASYTSLRVFGFLPGAAWIPRPIRILAYWVMFPPIVLWTILTGAVGMSQAFMSDEDWKRQQEWRESLRRAMEQERHV